VKISFYSILADFRKSVAFEGSVASPVCTSEKSNMQMNMSVELWWNDTHRNKEM
jgi:hypothetical protein